VDFPGNRMSLASGARIGSYDIITTRATRDRLVFKWTEE